MFLPELDRDGVLRGVTYLICAGIVIPSSDSFSLQVQLADSFLAVPI